MCFRWSPASNEFGFSDPWQSLHRSDVGLTKPVGSVVWQLWQEMANSLLPSSACLSCMPCQLIFSEPWQRVQFLT